MVVGWVLYDRFDDDPEPGAAVRVPISSADELRKELEALAALEPRIVELETPEGKWVRIGIGGPWAGFAIIEDVIQLRMRIAAAPYPTLCERIEFLCGQQPSTLHALNLFPVAQVIELVTHYFQTGTFPNNLQWTV